MLFYISYSAVYYCHHAVCIPFILQYPNMLAMPSDEFLLSDLVFFSSRVTIVFLKSFHISPETSHHFAHYFHLFLYVW